MAPDQQQSDTQQDPMLKRLAKVATVANARRWNYSTEQFAFCLNLLGLQPDYHGDAFCDLWVGRLEDRFEELLAIHGLGDEELPTGGEG